MKDALEAVGLKPKRASEYMAKDFGVNKKSLDGSFVPQEVIDAINYRKTPSEDGALSAMLKILQAPFDFVNGPAKENWTLPFPSFHVGNRIGGVVNNAVNGPFENPAEALEYLISEFAPGKGVWTKERFAPHNEGDMLNRIAHGVVGDQMRATDDIPIGGFSGKFWDLRDTWNNGSQRANDNPWLLQASPVIGKPIEAINKAHKSVLAAGSKLAGNVEYHNRANMFDHLVNDLGYDPVQAAREVAATQFRYENATPFEREILKRAFPFYGYTSNQFKATAKNMLKNPGGFNAQTLRVKNRARSQEDLLPPQLQETLAIPMGTAPDGTKRYFTGFRNPNETAFQYLALPFAQQNVLAKMLSDTTPLVKYPIEAATGETLFQKGVDGGGRPLNELDPTVGRLLANTVETATGKKQEPYDWFLGDKEKTRYLEHIIANSPASRYLTTARKMVDPRKSILDKAVGLSIPFNVTDVSPKTQERLLQAETNKAADRLGAKTWTNRYFNDSIKAGMSPSERQEAEAIESLWKEQRSRARKMGAAEKKKTAPSKKKKTTSNSRSKRVKVDY